MRFLKRYTKDPGETLDYEVDFSTWLTLRADTVSGFSVNVANGLQHVSSNLLGIGKVRGFVAGGVSGFVYSVAVTITTAGGRIKRAAILIRVRGSGAAGTETIIDGGVS